MLCHWRRGCFAAALPASAAGDVLAEQSNANLRLQAAVGRQNLAQAPISNLGYVLELLWLLRTTVLAWARPRRASSRRIGRTITDGINSKGRSATNRFRATTLLKSREAVECCNRVLTVGGFYTRGVSCGVSYANQGRRRPCPSPWMAATTCLTRTCGAGPRTRWPAPGAPPRRRWRIASKPSRNPWPVEVRFRPRLFRSRSRVGT